MLIVRADFEILSFLTVIVVFSLQVVFGFHLHNTQTQGAVQSKRNYTVLYKIS